MVVEAVRDIDSPWALSSVSSTWLSFFEATVYFTEPIALPPTLRLQTRCQAELFALESAAGELLRIDVFSSWVSSQKLQWPLADENPKVARVRYDCSSFLKEVFLDPDGQMFLLCFETEHAASYEDLTFVGLSPAVVLGMNDEKQIKQVFCRRIEDRWD